MRPTRLFHTLIICGAALTGGAATTVVTAVSVVGCNGDTTMMPIIEAPLFDMRMPVIDAMIPPPDLATKD